MVNIQNLRSGKGGGGAISDTAPKKRLDSEVVENAHAYKGFDKQRLKKV